MDYFIAFIIAYGLSFVGMVPPGMITMKLVSISFNKSVKAAILFALGVTFVEFFQTIITLHFSQLFVKQVGENIYVKWAAVIVLLVLAISFILSKEKKNKGLNKKELKEINKRTSFAKGSLLSVVNVFKYPFWIAQGVYFLNNGVIKDESSFLAVYSLGALTGSLSMYYVYIKLGKKLLTKFDKLADNINKILALFFIFLALLQILDIYKT